MTDLELIFCVPGKASTTEMTTQHDTQRFDENQEPTRTGGNIAGNARREME